MSTPVTLIIEQGATQKDINQAKKFKTQVESSKGDIFPVMKDIKKVFPDSNYNGCRVMIAVPTAMDIANPKAMKAAFRLVLNVHKELGWFQ